MNSANWTFVGAGKTTSVILKHGIDSGNLVIFCNMKIMLIDYDVFDKANYKFFIDEEFCEIKVWKRKGKFNYQFDVLDDVDTPLNKKRKEHSDHLFNKTVIKAFAALGIVAFLLLLGYGSRYFKAQKVKRVVRGTVLLKDHVYKEQHYNAAFSFEHKEQSLIRHLQLEELSDGTIILENGLPVHTGDEYLISFTHTNPNENEILFGKILAEQNEQLQGRVINRMLYLNPSLTTEYCICLLQNNNVNPSDLYASLYFQNYTPAQNPKHNRDTLSILMNHPDMVLRQKSCYYTFVEQCGPPPPPISLE